MSGTWARSCTSAVKPKELGARLRNYRPRDIKPRDSRPKEYRHKSKRQSKRQYDSWARGISQ